MIQNYFKIAWRNLMKRKFYSLVSILGLSVGITFTLLIGTYIWGELQVNADLKNVDNQYLIQSKWKQADMGVEIATLAPLAEALKENYPHLVENFYRFDGITSTFANKDKIFREEIQLGDSTILNMYGFKLLHGDATTALNQPYTMVLTAEQAIKYFGQSDVVGKTLTVESFSGSKKDFMITGVLDKLATNSITNLLNSTKSPVLMSFESSDYFGRGQFNTWNNPYNVGYITLKEGVKPESLAKPMAKLIKANAPTNISDNLLPYLTPVKEVYREANNGIVKKTIFTLTMTALFILLMAIVNFINISIGNSFTRLKEIGVRKMLGSMKGQIIRQFLAESILIALVSLLVALILFEIFQPIFGQILNKTIPSLLSITPYFFVFAILLALLIGLLSGMYPAFVLSNIPSIDSLKGKLKSIKENIFFRRLLIVSQFSIALFVGVGASVITKQVNYFFTKDLGYHKEAIITARVPRDWSPKGVEKMETIRNEMTKLKEVNNATLSYEIPETNSKNSIGIYKMGQDSTQAIYIPSLTSDDKYLETYQIPMVAGVFFQNKESSFQAGKMVLNEAGVKALGFKSPAQAIGQIVRLHFSPQSYTIVGVTKDFHLGSMHQAISPLAFMNVKENTIFRYLSFKIREGNIAESLSAIQHKWTELMPGSVFEYTFMDDTLKKLYQSEIQLKKASELATFLSVIIVVLGILGMVSMSIARRTKELGIRKVLGASSISIVMLFLKEFIVLICISIVIAFPLAVISMNSWLTGYAYRIELNWQIFIAIAIFFSLMIAFFVFLQTFKAALTNPIKSLKTE
ncbi:MULTISPECIES: ABC transporter permease [unclassified Arcicella]|uniref:ABC transporter permease n=1 Tax=unclassified Arcicella TaxID=2644986 RepID=UPI00285F4EFA|nr:MULTISPECIES: ABC transporter permease [unclassified Arcicella]MDR6563878.1 putative ABC transport system permease protein [Arcicella sp. BE51]MDR6813631.1 putative ABC transport system permease protein [Arcicella sp. BE140]MDR6824988.1 putative ABC transport system permease protein [Arcicella sp. BE139]